MTWSDLAKLWEKTAHPRIAQLCDSIDPGEPFVGDTDAWIVAARKLKTDDFPGRGPLLATLLDGKLDEVRRKLEAISKWRDPRLDAVLERALTEVPWSSNTSRVCWGSLFALVTASGNPRFTVLQKSLPRTWQVRSAQREWLEARFADAVTALPEAPGPLTEAQEKQLDAFQKTLAPKKSKPPTTKKSAIDFIAVYASPADDAPRLVLADALMEANDPRGEFLSLQLRANKSSADAKREKALLKAHQKEWVAAFGPSLGAQVEWRRGFPSAGLVKFKNPAEVAKFGSLAEWATFEKLEWSPARSPEHAAAAGHIGPAFRHLTHAVSVHVPTLLASKTTYALRSLQAWVGTTDRIHELRKSGLLPKLEALAIDDSTQTADWIEAVSEWPALREFGITATYPPTLLHVLARAERISTLERLRWGNALVFHRDAKGHFGRVELRDFRGSYGLADQFSQLPEGCITEFIEPPDAHWLTGPLGRELERISRKQSGAQSIAAAAARHLDLNGVLHLVVDRDRIVVGDGRSVRVVDAKTFEVQKSVTSLWNCVPSARDVMIFANDVRVRSFDSTDERVVFTDADIKSVSRSDDGSRFAVSNDNKVKVVDAATGEVLLQTAGAHPALDLTGKLLVVTRGQQLVLHDVDAGTSSPLDGWPATPMWLPDGRRAQLLANEVVITGERPLRIKKDMLATTLAGSRDGSRIAVIHPAESLIYDGRTGARVGTGPGGLRGAFDARGVLFVATGDALAKSGPFGS
ncbi:MAG: TIGR02996 domain-containing protein [Archangium sp.]